jgi:acetylxylan esterase
VITVAAPATPCAAVRIIAARGSNEAPGAGQMGAIVIRAQSTSQQTFPPLRSTTLLASLAMLAAPLAGRLTIPLLQKQVAACPNQRFALNGYSQVILH